MNIVYHYQHALTLLSECYNRKCEEVIRLVNNPKYAPTIVKIRQQEADELKEVLNELTKLNSNDLLRLQSFGELDVSMTQCINHYPDILGFNIIFGPDNPELFGYYYRLSWNMPISFFKK